MQATHGANPRGSRGLFNPVNHDFKCVEGPLSDAGGGHAARSRRRPGRTKLCPHATRALKTLRYTNPILPGFYPDPSICRVGGDYYLVTSSFEYFPGVPIFHSRDLVNWRQVGHCLTRAGQLPLEKAGASRGIFAPTIRYHDGLFYMVTTNVTNGGNFFVTAKDPTGEWSEPVWLDQEGIDPSLLFDDDGKVYLTTNKNRQSIIDPTTGKRLSEVRTTWAGTSGFEMEAPHLYRINGRYYLIVAEGGTSRGHMVTVARADNPWGPFESCPHNPILTHRDVHIDSIEATGHADLIRAHNGSWWMVFLGIRELPGPFPQVHNLGRETFLAPVTWTDDGWPVVNRTGTVALEMEGDLPALHPWPDEPARDDFDRPRLQFCWNFLRNPYEGDWSLTERPGWLRLKGSAVTLDDTDSPACVLRRQQHHACEASALLEFTPAHVNERAGLTVLMNPTHHYDLAVTTRDGQRWVELHQRIGELHAVTARDVVPAGAITLGVTADTGYYSFWYDAGDAHRKHLGRGTVRHLSTEVAGGFTGVYLGLFATGDGKRSTAEADFDWFEYQPIM